MIKKINKSLKKSSLFSIDLEAGIFLKKVENGIFFIPASDDISALFFYLSFRVNLSSFKNKVIYLLPK